MQTTPHARDPRVYQICILGALLLYGFGYLGFEFNPWLSLLIITTTLASQYFFSTLLRLPRFDPKSALISGLSLVLLLRTDVLIFGFAAGVLAIGSKFLIRWRGKHIFNPTNFALAVLVLAADRDWVSPRQWGDFAYFAFLVACLGMLVINRARRADVTLTFLLAYATLLFTRAIWLGDPITIPAHQLQSGALLIFAFFMLSDPKTTPNSNLGRVLFGFMVACATAFAQFWCYRSDATLFALIACAPLVPVIDWLLPATRPLQQQLGPYRLTLEGERV